MPEITGLISTVRILTGPRHVGESRALTSPPNLRKLTQGHRGPSLQHVVASEQVRCRHLPWLTVGTPVICSVDRQLQAAAHSNFMEQLFRRLPVTMATQKPFRLALCTWPASIPSGMGMCHHRNSFPHLNKGLLDRQGWGGGAGSSGPGQDSPWPSWQ